MYGNMLHNEGEHPHQKGSVDMHDSKEQLAKALEEIAKNHLGIPTLRTQDSDSLDFHEVSVWSLKAALEAAYYYGRCDH